MNARISAILCLSVLLVACDRTSTTDSDVSSKTFTLAPRIVSANGAALPAVDSVRIVALNANSPTASPYYDKTLDYNLHADTIKGIPQDAQVQVQVTGIKEQPNKTAAQWWSGLSKVTFSGTQTVDVQSPVVPVFVGDTLAPQILLRTGDTIENMDTILRLTWHIREDSAFTAQVNGGAASRHGANDSVVWTHSWATGKSLPVVAWFRDTSGNVSRDSLTAIRRDRAAAPTFSVASGSFNDLIRVGLASETSGATLEYSLDTCRTWLPYTDSILLGSRVILYARALKAGMTTSAVSWSGYVIQAAQPVFSLAAGTYDSTQSVAITTATPGAMIYYTTNGASPSATSTLYHDPVPVAVAQSLQAVTVKANLASSSVSSARYMIDTVKAPTFSRTAGTYTGSRNVALSSETLGAGIHYTVDGSVPTATSPLYTDSIAVDTTETVRAIALKAGRISSPIVSSGYTIRAMNPVFSPVAGRYDTTQSVSIITATSGASIYYTTDGSTPTISSTKYAGPIKVDTTEVFKAIAVKTGNTTSLVTAAAYVLDTVMAPTFSLATGTYTGAQKLALTSATPGASIHYTVDGSVPTATSPLYTDLIVVDTTETVRAVAMKAGQINSSIASLGYTIRAMYPVFSPAAGRYDTTQSVSITSATSGASIYYTTDGSTPTISSTKYTGPIKVDTTEVLKAIVVKNGNIASLILTGTYVIDTVKIPTFSLVTGTYIGTQKVALVSSTPGASIRYSLDGSVPTATSSLYTDSIVVDTTETVRAIAMKAGRTNSPVVSSAYTITVKAPTFSLVTGTYIGTQKVALVSSTPGASIRYSLDGSVPTATSSLYTDSIVVDTSETINAIERTGRTNSLVTSSAYIISAMSPVFSPVAGAYDTTQSVSITSATSGASLYYTTDGSVPTISSTKYAGPITVSASDTLKAIAVRKGNTASAVSNAAYVIDTVKAPTFSLVAGTYTGARKVTLASATLGVSIYYTTDGSTPTISSAKYADSIVVDTTETVRAIALKTGRTNSPVASAAYTITAMTPVFSPVAGIYDTTQSVSITSATSGASIYYTTDGSNPSTSSTLYAGPVTVAAAQTLKAIAVKKGNTASAAASARYSLQASAPTFTPPASNYDTTQMVTLATTTHGATIYYTVNGTDPTTTSVVYLAPIRITATQTVKAIAVKAGISNSIASSANYVIDTVSLPVFSPAQGYYDALQSVSITTTTPGATIYYTINGGTPTTSSRLYSGPFAVGSNSVISAIAVKTGMTSSPVANSGYSFPIPWNPSVTYGTLIDTRDKKSYRTVVIGSSIWMAENLNYSGAGVCYGNNADSCTKYGRLYTWGEAMGLGLSGNTESWTGGDVNQQGICPTGWHLPSDTEWTLMANSIGQLTQTYLSNAPAWSGGIALIATNGWLGTIGTDVVGFRALPGGLGDAGSGAFVNKDFYAAGITYGGGGASYWTAWWTATDAKDVPWYRFLNSSSKFLIKGQNSKTYGLSVRCVSGTAPVSAPKFSPAPGTYNTTQTVTLSSATVGATIYYTTDGTTPTTSSSVYSAPIPVTTSDTIKALAVKEGLTNSQVSEGDYLLTPKAAVFNFPSSFVTDRTNFYYYASPQTITLSSTTADADIYYTLTTTGGRFSMNSSTYAGCSFTYVDSATVVGTGTKYIGPITIDSNTTIQAFVKKAGWVNSPIATYYFAIQTPAPSFSVSPGAYETAQSVALTADAGASIYYTTDGTTPTTSSTLYTGPIQVDTTQTIRAFAVKSGWKDGDISIGTFSIIPWNSSVTYGTLHDTRDGKDYNTVTIGAQTWMAQNLNYRNSIGSTDSVGTCSGNTSVNCNTFGRLYTWAEVMQGAGSSSTSPSGVQGICPVEWHVPSDAEWTTMQTFVDAANASDGTKLKSTSGWISGGNGTDTYGFRALSGGYFNGTSVNSAAGYVGHWWSATAYDASDAWRRYMYYSNAYVGRSYSDKTYGLSLRCVKDN